MRNILLIAKREYLEQVRGRAFKMTTIGVPAIFGLIIFVGYHLQPRPRLGQAPGSRFFRSGAGQ